MPKNCLFCISLKTSAVLMAFNNLLGGLSLLIVCGIQLKHEKYDDIQLYLIIGLVFGTYNLFTGLTLLYGIIKADHKAVLLYILLQTINLFIATIFTGINTFEYESAILVGWFISCLLLWHGLYCVYSYYLEMAEYNNPVKSGAIEISYDTNINPLMQLPEKAIENTAV